MTEDEKEARNWAVDWAWDGTMYWCLRNEEELLGMQFAIRAFLAGVEHGRPKWICVDEKMPPQRVLVLVKYRIIGKPREGETNGLEYHFLEPSVFTS